MNGGNGCKKLGGLHAATQLGGTTDDTADVEFRSFKFRLETLFDDQVAKVAAFGSGPFRMFGYVDPNDAYSTAAVPLISARVIHDTAFSLEIINGSLLH